MSSPVTGSTHAAPRQADRPGGASARGRLAGAIAALSRWLAFSVVVLAPLPFGSVAARWTAIWCMMMAVSLALAGFTRIEPRAWRVLMLVLIAYAAFIAVVVLQLQGAQPDPAWSQAAGLLDLPLPPIASASRLGPVLALGNSLLFVMTFCRMLLLAGERRSADQLFRVLAWSGLGYALFAILSFAHDPTMVLWRVKAAYLTNLTGTFVNRNTAATFFGTASVLWLLALLSDIRFGASSGLRWTERVWLLSRGRDLGTVMLALGLVLCLSATAATGSRAGFMLTLLSLLVAGCLYGRPSLRGLLSRPWAWLAVALAAVLLVEIIGGSVTNRMHMLGIEDKNRFEVYVASLHLVEERPWLGIGLGNFAAVFPTVRPDTILVAGLWDRAHSTPLEIAIEMGLPLVAIVILLWLWLGGTLARACATRRDPLVIAGGAIGLLGSLHALVDFSLQIPGYAVIFAAAAGLGLARACAPAGAASESLRLRGRRSRRPGAERLRRPQWALPRR